CDLDITESRALHEPIFRDVGERFEGQRGDAAVQWPKETRQRREPRSVFAQRSAIEIPYRRHTIEQRESRLRPDERGHLRQRHLPTIRRYQRIVEYGLIQRNTS